MQVSAKATGLNVGGKIGIAVRATTVGGGLFRHWPTAPQ
jgi:hypothetical protein